MSLRAKRGETARVTGKAFRGLRKGERYCAVRRRDKELVLRWGKVGGSEQENTLSFGSAKLAESELEKRLRKKVKAGYEERWTEER